MTDPTLGDSPAIDVVTEDEGWAALLADPEALAADVLAAARAEDPALAAGSAALLLTDDARMRALNARFRGWDAPTNVLAFPSGGENGFHGDIALARETCAREAAAASIPLRDHAAHLIAHGLLHLIGYDHQEDPEAEAMERCEAAILGRLGIADPYAEHQAAPRRAETE